VGTNSTTKSKSQNFDDIPNATMRSIHNTTDRVGNVGTNSTTKSKSQNFDDIPNATMRSIHNTPDRVGNVGTNSTTKSKSQNFDDIPNATMRSIHNTTDRAGNMGTNHTTKNKVFNINDIPQITNREIYAKTDRAGNIGTSKTDKSYTFDPINMTPKTTMREIHGKNEYLNPAKSQDKQRSRQDANNMQVNLAKEKSLERRCPTPCNYNKGPTFDYTTMTLRTPTQINREPMPNRSNNELDCRSKPNFTQNGHTLPQTPYRFYEYVEENLQNNPYVNNVVHHAGI